jgi:hydroxymethylbilane synthase
MTDKICIGTRSSRLALWQAHFVAEKLQNAGFGTEICLIETKGDRMLDTAIAKIGSKGVFTQELEDRLRQKSIDIAVHSAKDLASELPPDLEIIAFTEREAAHDVLVGFQDKNEFQFSPELIIGTSSTRRVALLRHFHPEVRLTDMRGNLQTRMQKMQNGTCHALMLAFAGVHRMDLQPHIVHHFPVETFVPAVGQGSMAVQIHTETESDLKTCLRQSLNHRLTESCLLAERAFLAALQGGCSVPVFGLARWEGEKISLTGGVVSLNGETLLRQTHTGTDPVGLGRTLAEKILRSGGKQILDEIRGQG